MTELVERVAKALQDCDPSAGAPYEQAARAAIEAMRDTEPTPEMMAAMWSLRFSNTKESFVVCWQAMIDAALSPTDTPPEKGEGDV